VQQAKDVNSTKAAIDSATANKIQAEYDNVVATRTLRDGIAVATERVCALAQSGRMGEAVETLEGVNSL
jgi:hypothetical protein